MGLFAWLIIGILVAVVVKMLRPASSGAFSIAAVIATTGALIGGYICAVFSIGTLATLEPRALLAALAGSLVFIFLFRKLRIN
jgi:uncharacterized membrane protein YeaQ/YmgE (transglycosylase-associated protein family)